MQDNFVKKMADFETLLGYYTSRVICRPLIPPEHVYFSLTNRCNLRCRMCEIAKDATSEEAELSTEEIKRIILQIRDMGIRHIIFSGGEPLLRKDLAEIIKFARQEGIEMADLITNATLLDEGMAEKLIGAGLTHIGISIDGLSPTSSRIRGPGVFEKVVENINSLNQYKNSHGLNAPSIGINFTIMGDNIGDILPLAGLARKMRCLFISFQPVLFNNTKMYMNGKNALWPDSRKIRQLKKVIGELLKSKKDPGGDNVFTDADVLNSLPDYFLGKRPAADFKCYEAIKRIVITCEGKLWSCQGILGDLKKDTLSRIWNSERTKKARQDIKKCKRHCLQDCVYFPSDITRIARQITRPNFLTLSTWKDEPRKKLIGRIDAYIKILSEDRGDRGDFLSRFSRRRAVKNARDKLAGVKGYFLNRYTPLCRLSGRL